MKSEFTCQKCKNHPKMHLINFTQGYSKEYDNSVSISQYECRLAKHKLKIVDFDERTSKP